MGKYIGTIEDLNLLGRLQDPKYHSKYNNIIKKELSRLKSVIQLIKDTMGSDPECTEANIYLQKIYLDNLLAWEGEDNWFCYHLGNKLNKEAGLEPLHNLE